MNERIAYGFRLVTARTPGQSEVALLRSAYTENLQRYELNKPAALKLMQVGDSRYNTSLNISKLAAMTRVARLLLNLNESITKG